jgi:hypothetical protein
MTSSLVCSGGAFEVSRVCPSQSFCANGYCNAPGGNPMSCDAAGPNELDCLTTPTATLSCQPFVDPSNPVASQVKWFCDDPVGVGLPGDPCTTGSECRSGFCGSNGTCFRACTTSCPAKSHTGMPLHCAAVTIDVEGVMVSATSCIP